MTTPPAPTCAATIEDCLVLAEWYADDYPLFCGWQQCLEQVLPPLSPEIWVHGRRYRHCLAFLVDDELGAHFIFDEGDGLEELLLSEVHFAEPLSPVARLWVRAYLAWRNGTTHRRRRPLCLVG